MIFTQLEYVSFLVLYFMLVSSSIVAIMLQLLGLPISNFINPVVRNPFILYTFASDKSYAAILTQANQDKGEAPITFFSSNLQGAELNYYDVEKQAYVVSKAIKYFRPFLLKTHTKIIVPFPVVRNLLV